MKSQKNLSALLFATIFLMSITAFAQQAASKNEKEQSNANVSKEKLSAHRTSHQAFLLKDGFRLNEDKTVSPIEQSKKKTLTAKPVQRKTTQTVSKPSSNSKIANTTLMQKPSAN